MRASLPVLVATSLLGLCAACGDDSGAVLAKDAGVARDSGAGPDAIPRVDSGMPVGQGQNAIPQCDRYDATTCGAGETCDEVTQYLPATGETVIYTGCVEVSGLRGLGDPCTPWNDRYTLVPEEVYYDPCGDGLVCSADPDVRGATSCQPICQSGTFGDAFVGCESQSAFCLSVGAYQEVCAESDQCDPVAQTGCAKDEACYLRLNDTADGYLTLCLAAPAAADAVADHEACMYVNDCTPGSSCTGPVHLEPAQWTSSDFACRPLCTGLGDGADAGADDAGAAGECPGVAECVPFAESSLGFGQLAKAPFGQCER